MKIRSAIALVALALGACGDNIKEPAVLGVVFEDVDGDGVQDPEERPLSGITVYVDLDDNGDLDPFDLAAITDPSGAYRIELPLTGEVAVRQKVPFGMANVSGGAAPEAPPARPHIIGGSDASANEYPFMAAVGFAIEGVFTQICGAALIAPRFVLTAGHCSEDVEPEQVRVLLGSSDLEDGTVVEVRAVHIHPAYAGDVTLGNDVAVWELAEPVDFDLSPELYTLELAAPETAELTAAGALATTLGWGVSDNDSALLQEVHVPITSVDDCSAGYPDVESFATQICAGVPEGGIDSCGGDSGGPLIVRDPERQVWVQAGVTSWGDGCALPGKPGVYARTSALSAWIRETASDPSRVHRLQVGGEEVRADFGNQENLRPLPKAIDSRVQLTALTPAGAPDGVVDADTPVDLDFRVISDGTAAEMSCQLDPDGPGPLGTTPVDCALGENRVTHAGYPDGAFRADLILELGAQLFVRSAFLIAGTPSSDVSDGSLTTSDQTDPDFMSTYFIDHYELTGTTENTLTIVEIEPQFGAYVALYDGDVRDGSGGGTLDVLFITEGTGTFRFFTAPGKRYLLGISTLDESATGAYRVELINNGTLEPRSL